MLYLACCDVDVQCLCNLGEEPPPLPVLEFEVTGAVPLDDLHGSELLLTFTERPEGTEKDISRVYQDSCIFLLQTSASGLRVSLTCGPGSLWLVPGRR